MKGSERLEKFQISLAAARVNAEMTQEEVAKALGVSKQTVVNWEKGRIKPGIPVVWTLAKLYGISTDHIFLPK